MCKIRQWLETCLVIWIRWVSPVLFGLTSVIILPSLPQLSSGNPVYENLYRQVGWWPWWWHVRRCVMDVDMGCVSLQGGSWEHGESRTHRSCFVLEKVRTPRRHAGQGEYVLTAHTNLDRWVYFTTLASCWALTIISRLFISAALWGHASLIPCVCVVLVQQSIFFPIFQLQCFQHSERDRPVSIWHTRRVRPPVCVLNFLISVRKSLQTRV